MELQSFSPPNTPEVSIHSVTDRELITRVRCDEIEAFEIIMRRYNQRLYRIARSILKDEHEAMDVVQETFVKAYYKLHQFKGSGGLACWLSRIASNEALMRVRKLKIIHYTLDDPSSFQQEEESTNPQPLDELANKQLRSILEDAIETLPVNYRCVYVMRAIQHLSTVETAKSLNVTEQVVKTRYLRAKRALQKVIEGHMEKAGLKVYEFAGQRCDSIVQVVMRVLRSDLISDNLISRIAT